MKILIIFYIIFLFNMSARNLYSDEIKIDQEKYIYITELNETYIDMKNLCKIIEERFKIKTQLLKTFSDVEFALNRKRYQYYAPEILKKLLIYIPRNGIRLLGLLDKDIYDNGLNFVF
ncbi:MAG: hypothetical protein N2114_02150 [Candidatus Goldbacteria bacterium]|nr:hypothetical protein [Candidatus Goldiibacteriota bacterium]